MGYSLEKMFGMEGKVVIITGGTKGIGKEAAKALLDIGAIPVMWGSTEKSVGMAREDFKDATDSYEIMQVDVGDEAAVEKAVAAVMEKYGHIDGLVNSAGTSHLEAFDTFDISEYERVMHVNVTGTMICCKHVGKIMKAQGKGCIVNVSSVRGFQGKDRYSAYASSKGAINNLTHTLGVELAPLGVRVNAIAPCFIRTDISEVVLKDESFKAWVMSRLPAGRLGELSDCAGAIVFLLSDASPFVIGSVLPVDGGWLAG